MIVMIVDDQTSARMMLRNIIEEAAPQLQVTDFGDPTAALHWAEETTPDLVLLDYRMPGCDGLEFLRRFRRSPVNRDVPVILVTAVGDEPVRHAALEVGVLDFLVKPVKPRELRARCSNLLQLRSQAEQAKHRAERLERRLINTLAQAEERELNTMLELARIAEERHGGSRASLTRLSAFAALIADWLCLPIEQVRSIEQAAPLHDLGKLALPDGLLLHPGPLDDTQQTWMREHARVGHGLLAGCRSATLKVGATIALRHHERFDGSGYPDGLAGDAIPLEARIAAVADAFDALLSPRPWRDPWTLDQALAHLAAERGGAFDPSCVDALVASPDKVAQILQAYPNPAPPGQDARGVRLPAADVAAG